MFSHLTIFPLHLSISTLSSLFTRLPSPSPSHPLLPPPLSLSSPLLLIPSPSPSWMNGENHILFFMLPSAQTQSFVPGYAMVAGGGFPRSQYREGLDISTPVFNPLTFDVRYPPRAIHRCVYVDMCCGYGCRLCTCVCVYYYYGCVWVSMYTRRIALFSLVHFLLDCSLPSLSLPLPTLLPPTQSSHSLLPLSSVLGHTSLQFSVEMAASLT